MSATLVARGLAAAAADRQLYSGLDLVVAPGDVIGLVGANGAGKTTLLRILAALAEPSAGTVALSPATAAIGYLPQETEPLPGETVLGMLARRTGVAEASERLETATELLATGDEDAGDVYGDALERWLALGAADFEVRAAATLGGLDLAGESERPMTDLSGGQGARARLAALIVSRYDLYLLDEPTNDLDLEGLDRLEHFVGGLRAGAVIVSHDREFLARTVNSVLELDPTQRTARLYGGDYTSYLAERAVVRRHAKEDFDEYAGRRRTLEERGQTQRTWTEKGVRNAVRKAPDRDKSAAARRRESSEQQASKVRQTERLLERLDVVEAPRREWELQLTIRAAPRAGSVVAALADAVVRRGAFTLGPVSLQVDWADRISITGANGSGKSTLIGALLGRVALDGGSASLGPSVVVGEVDQVRETLLGPESLLDAFSTASDLLPVEARTLLAKFGLSADHVLRPASLLSPGERTRAALAMLQARGVNLLVLDEPTNHLDLPAIEQLEEALAAYQGTLILVTHDRRLLDSVSANRRLEVDGGRVSER